jgi:hypothetical protein
LSVEIRSGVAREERIRFLQKRREVLEHVGIKGSVRNYQSHWSKRMTVDNPHGLTQSMIEKMNSMTPAQRESKLRQILSSRKTYDAKMFEKKK